MRETKRGGSNPSAYANQYQVNMTKKEKWEKCNTCGDYEYCAGNYGTDKCTGYIPGNNIEE